MFIVLTSRITNTEIKFLALSRIIEIRDKKEFNETKLNLSICNNGRLKVFMTKTELQTD